jgi:hypothetical protein
MERVSFSDVISLGFCLLRAMNTKSHLVYGWGKELCFTLPSIHIPYILLACSYMINIALMFVGVST